MNYEERIDKIKAWFLADITTRFSTPSGVDPKITAKDTIEGVNSALPSKLTPEKLTFILNKTTSEIVRTAKTRTLPIVRDFASAVTAAAKIYSEANGEAAIEPSRTHKVSLGTHITAARIRAGEAISESYLRGTLKEELLNGTDITEKDLATYYKAVEQAARMQ